MSDIKCPRCGTTKYRNPSLKLLVNSCGHGICESCVELLFAKGSGTCPKCNVTLRRHKFKLQLFEDEFIEKEIQIREKVLKDFNKTEEDFETLNEYNDYLEEIETVIYNLANNIDYDETKRKWENYKKDNAMIIQKNQGKLGKDLEEINEILEQEKEEKLIREQIIAEEEQVCDNVKREIHSSLVDELMFSDMPASQILAEHKVQQRIKEQDILTNVHNKVHSKSQEQKQSRMFSTGIAVGKGSSVFQPMSKVDNGQLYEYVEPIFDLNGPECPSIQSLDRLGYLRHVRSPSPSEKAGGFKSEYACYRALQESFSSLYYK